MCIYIYMYIYICVSEISCNNHHNLGIDIPVLDKLKKSALRRKNCIKSRRDFTNRTHVGGHNVRGCTNQPADG